MSEYRQRVVVDNTPSLWRDHVANLSRKGWRVIPETYQVKFTPQGDTVFTAFFETDDYENAVRYDADESK